MNVRAPSWSASSWDAPRGRVARARSVISIVDDDESMREAAKGLMRSLGYNAVAFPSAEAFLRSRQLSRTTCLIADFNMPGMTGLDLCRRLSSSGTPIPTILITAYPDDRARDSALKAGVVCYLTKPFDESDLLSCIQLALATDEP
jgi:FixJ family two-component response regulator